MPLDPSVVLGALSWRNWAQPLSRPDESPFAKLEASDCDCCLSRIQDDPLLELCSVRLADGATGEASSSNGSESQLAFPEGELEGVDSPGFCAGACDAPHCGCCGAEAVVFPAACD